MITETLKNLSGQEIKGPMIIKPKLFNDERGFFMESWNQKVFNEIVGKEVLFVQDNHYSSKKGVLRGMHYQLPPHPQGKLVRCVEGKIYDVIIDIRKQSPTFGNWFGVYLDSIDHLQLWIPEGFAHGFLTISEEAQVLYKTTDFWFSSSESSIKWDDPQISIQWPRIEKDFILSRTDSQALELSKKKSNQLF